MTMRRIASKRIQVGVENMFSLSLSLSIFVSCSMILCSLF